MLKCIQVTASYFCPTFLKELVKSFQVIFTIAYTVMWTGVLIYMNRTKEDFVPITLGLIAICISLINGCLIDSMPTELRVKRSKTMAICTVFMMIYIIGLYFNWMQVDKEIISSVGEMQLTTTSAIGSISSTLCIFLFKFAVKALTSKNYLTFVQADVQVERMTDAEAKLLTTMYEVDEEKYRAQRKLSQAKRNAADQPTNKVVVNAAEVAS